MKQQFLFACVIAVFAVACTLSVSDSNPKPASVFGAGEFAPSISGGKLVLNGSGLNNVSSVRIGANKDRLDIEGQTSSMLVAKLPAALTLPTLLWVRSANASETSAELNRLGALTVDGSFVVNGQADIGYERKLTQCVGTFCEAQCQAGKKVVGGGCSTGSSNTPITGNYPFSETSWACKTTISAGIETFAICVRAVVQN